VTSNVPFQWQGPPIAPIHLKSWNIFLAGDHADLSEVVRHMEFPVLQHLDVAVAGRDGRSLHSWHGLIESFRRKAPPLKSLGLSCVRGDVVHGEEDLVSIMRLCPLLKEFTTYGFSISNRTIAALSAIDICPALASIVLDCSNQTYDIDSRVLVDAIVSRCHAELYHVVLHLPGFRENLFDLEPIKKCIDNGLELLIHATNSRTDV